METIPILKQLGLSDKEIKVYLALIANGPSSVRSLALASKINRGTTYDILKSLKENGLVSYYHKATKQFFAAEDPAALNKALEQKMAKLTEVKKNLSQVIPELKSLFDRSGDKPVVKYYEGGAGVKTVLTDVLETSNRSVEKLYYVFSSSAIRDYLYKAFPSFTKERIKLGLKVKVIALGHEGTPAELSEKRVLPGKESSPTYILIYPGKVAMISVNSAKQPLGLIIEDPALSQTQLQLFNFIWQSL
ncbi:MAG: TrmB family transcriptional regulator [Candidatus Komeilibacteria bacterium]|nr:TrmB family transcriptional regulator [Candidatus Komeilibacteria bacterium]